MHPLPVPPGNVTSREIDAETKESILDPRDQKEARAERATQDLDVRLISLENNFRSTAQTYRDQTQLHEHADQRLKTLEEALTSFDGKWTGWSSSAEQIAANLSETFTGHEPV